MRQKMFPGVLLCALLVALPVRGQNSPATLKCSASLWQVPSAGNPEDTWKADTQYTQGGDPDKEQTAYYTGDLLIVSESGISGLFAKRSADLPNSNLRVLTFDAREVVIDGPLYFDSTRVQIYADTVRFTARGTITLVSKPAQGQTDGVEIYARTLVVDQKNYFPLSFMTADPDWKDVGTRDVTLVAASVQGRQGTLEDVARSLTLDGEFKELLTDQSSAYKVPKTRALAQAQLDAKLASLLWPEEFADKIAREFSRAPFDPTRAKFLRAKGQPQRDRFLQSGHIAAAATLDNVFSAMNEGVDELGFQPYFIPRTSFQYEKAIFLGDTSANPTDQGLRGRLLAQVDAWDKLLVELKTKGANLDLSAIDDTRFKSAQAETKARTALAKMDDLQNQAVRINSDLGNVKVTLEQETENINHCRADLDARDKAKKNILTVARVGATVVGVAAGGVTGLAIGAALNVAGTVVAGKSTGGTVDSGQIIQALPEFVEQTKQLQEDAEALKSSWKSYQDGKAELNKAASDADKKKATEKRDAAWGKFQDGLNSTFSHGTKLAGTLSTQPPSQVTGDICQAQDSAYQDAIKRQASLMQEQAQVNDATKTEIGNLQATRDDLAELSLKEEFLRSARIRNDQEDSRLEALAWMLRQRHIRDLAYNTGVLLRSYKYHTGKDVISSFNSTYFASYYRLQRPNTGQGSSQEASTLWPTPEALAKALSGELAELTREMNEVQVQIEQGYKEYLAVLGTTHQDLSVPLIVSVPDGELAVPLGRRAAFIRAINDEISRQLYEIDNNVTEIRPAAIPLPEGLSFFASVKPQKIYDASVTSVTFDGEPTGRDGTIELGIIHPFTGVVYFQNNCATVDLRKYDDSADVQTYWTSCDQTGHCSHKEYNKDDLFKKENQAVVALPLYAPYFLTVRVRSQQDPSMRKISRVTSMSLSFSYIE